MNRRGVNFNGGANDVQVRGNIITNNTGIGVFVADEDNNQIKKNIISGNRRGIFLSGGSTGNNTTGNLIESNTLFGIEDLSPDQNSYARNRCSDNNSGGVQSSPLGLC